MLLIALLQFDRPSRALREGHDNQTEESGWTFPRGRSRRITVRRSVPRMLRS